MSTGDETSSSRHHFDTAPSNNGDDEDVIHKVRDMLKSYISHTPNRRVDRVATTPLTIYQMDKNNRKLIYDRILELSKNPEVLPLTYEEAKTYLEKISQSPLRSNGLFPPDELMFARSLKTTRQYAYVRRSGLCSGRGLWLKPGVDLPKDSFLGIYVGWVIDDTMTSIWDMEDLDYSYALGLLDCTSTNVDTPTSKHTQAIVHAQDRMYLESHEIFPLAYANEWIWTSTEPPHSDGNSLRFGKYGMVFSTRCISACTNAVELTIGLGREGVPFSGWTSYKKTLMKRLLDVLRMILLQAQQLELETSLWWQHILDEIGDSIDLLRCNTLSLLREDRSAIAIILAGVENDSEFDNSITISFDTQISLMDNLRQMVQHPEVRKRCNFRFADRPHHPTSTNIGTVKFWSQIILKEKSKKRVEVVGLRRSQRIHPQNLSEKNVLVLVNESGERQRVTLLPMALVPDNSGNSGHNQIEVHSLHLHRGQECVVTSIDATRTSPHCEVKLKSGLRKEVLINELQQPGVSDFLDASWTIDKGSTKIQNKPDQNGATLSLHDCVQYGEDYSIMDENIEALGKSTAFLGATEVAETYGTPLLLQRAHQLRVATWNASGLKTIRKLRLAIALMQTASLDILCIQDARIEPGVWSEELYRQAKEALGPGSSVFIAKVSARASSSMGPNVGGQVIFKSARAGVSTNFWYDESNLGVVCSLDIKMGGADIRLVSVYVPPDKGSITMASVDFSPQSTLENDLSLLDRDFVYHGRLTSRVHQFTQQYRQGESAAEYILTMAQARMQDHLDVHGCAVVCVGDFNANGTPQRPSSINGDIKNWSETNGLLNAAAVLRTDGQCPKTFYRQGNGVSDIDHVLFSRDKGLLPTGWRVMDDSLWKILSNHCPLVIDFDIPQFVEAYSARRRRRRKRAKLRLDICRNATGSNLDTRPQNQIDLFQKYMRRLHQRPSDIPQDRLMDIMTVTKAALVSINRRRKQCSLWSPEIVSLMANQIAVTEMSRYLEGRKGRPTWKKQKHITNGMIIILKNWERQILRLVQHEQKLGEKGSEHWLNFSGHGPAFWNSISWERDELLVQVIREKRRLSRLISNRDRQEWYEKILESKQMRQKARLQNKHLRELRSLLGTSHNPFSMDYLVIADRLLLNQNEIHSTVTKHFHDWFKRSEATWGFHNVHNDFHKLWTDKSYFFSKHVETNIPLHLLDIIWTAMQPPATVPMEDQESFEVLLQAAPTLEEFREAIRNSPTHSAGGPMEVTYNAMAAWSDEVVEEFHHILSNMWTNKDIPKFWKWRWLVPIPKVQDNVQLDDLRPLMLTDVTRKIWVGIVVNKIQQYWKQQGLLSEAQHGFLENKSTEGALLQFRNVLEEARESCTDVFLSSWDIRRAFDRVPKQLLILGWMRLGVPQAIADYLVSMDVDGLTMVRTPLAQDQWDRWGAEGFSDISQPLEPLLASFSTETGTGQGNIDSPLNWTAIMDIMLRALETADRHPFYVRTCTSRGTGLSRSPDVAYADDLISLTSRLEGLQCKADVVCAFCLVFGLEIAIAKLRAYKVHWGRERTDALGLSLDDSNEGIMSHYIDIHLEDWTVRKVKVNGFESAAPIKYLGVLFDLNNRDISLKRWAQSLICTALSKLKDRALDAELKVDGILYILYPKLLYSAQIASWSLREFEMLDEVFSNHFRLFLGLRKSFPAELLYAPEAVCGVGISRFSNEAHVRKLAVLFRGLISDGDTKQATIGLVHRGLRLQNQKPVYTQYAPLQPWFVSSQPLFVRSLVEWLNIARLSLAKGGQIFMESSFTSISQYLNHRNTPLSTTQISILEAHGISTIGDIISTGMRDDSNRLRRGRSRTQFEDTQNAQELIGRRVSKIFPPFGQFEGSIQSFDYPWFKVLYDDDDSEELTISEIWEVLTGEVPSLDEQHAPRWVRFSSEPLRFLNDMLPILPPQIHKVLVMRDQCFMSSNKSYPMQEGWIWEVLGISGTELCIRTWQLQAQSVSRIPRQGDQVALISSSLGAATEIWLSMEEMFGSSHHELSWFRVIMGPDRSAKKIHRLVLHIFRQPPVVVETPEMVIPLLQALSEGASSFEQNLQCFTDGSLLLDTNPIVEAIVPPSLTAPARQIGSFPQSSGALVIRGKDLEALEPSEMMIRVTNGAEVHCGNSYDIELLLLTLGCVFRWIAAVFTTPGVTIDLFSDCKSAVDIANMTDINHIRHNGHKAHGILLRQIFLSKFRPDLAISHVYGHPERKLSRDDSWQHLKGEEAGIYLADAVAGPKYSSVECKSPLIEITAKEVLKAMRCLEDCVIVDQEDTPILEDPLTLVQHHQFIRYLENRDNRKNSSRWTTYLRSAPQVVSGHLNRFTVRARRTKLVFNWYLREEHVSHHDTTILCPLCLEDMNGDSERHLYCECKYVEIENVRLETLDKLRNLVYGDGTAPQIALQILAKLYVLLTTTWDKHLIWKGVIPREYWEELVNTLPQPEQLSAPVKRRIIDDIRTALRMMGAMVQHIRRLSIINKCRPNMPPPVVGELTPMQTLFLQTKTQTRLPALWGIMTPDDQINWEVQRRLQRKRVVRSLDKNKKQTPMTQYFPVREGNNNKGLLVTPPSLVPACLVIKELFTRRMDVIGSSTGIIL